MLDLRDSKHILNKLRTQINAATGERLWEDLSGILPTFGPRTDIFQDPDHVYVVIEVPGLTTCDQIKLSSNGKMLHLSGDIQSHYPVGEEDLFRSERSLGRFNRKLPLPSEVDPRSAGTKLSNGLLYITFRRLPEPAEQEIAIRSEE